MKKNEREEKREGGQSFASAIEKIYKARLQLTNSVGYFSNIIYLCIS